MAIGDKHHPTPKKAAILGTISYLQGQNLFNQAPSITKAGVFHYFGTSNTRGWEILRNNHARRHPDIETRGRKRILSPANLQAMEKVMWQFGFQGRSLTWQGLALQAGVPEVSSRTVQRAMGTLGYRKCIACEKGWVSPCDASRRVEAAKTALQYRPHCEDWRDIRWSDECHFGLCSEGKIQIIRKPGERYCPDCIHHAEKPVKGDEIRRLHVWAAVGWGFKSELVFYEVPTNTNGKMSHQIYRDEILDKVVGPWLSRGDQFVLEEDGDSGHGGGNSQRKNIVKEWKEKHGLKHFFNTPSSPDLSPIENCWRAVKSFVRANLRVGVDIRDLVVEGWRRINQETINRWVDSMVVRMQDVLDNEGKLTGW